VDGDDGSGWMAADDAGVASVADEGAGGEDHDGSVGGGGGADGEDCLAAGAGVEQVALCLGGDVAGEVDGHGVVDGDEVFDLEEEADVVGMGEVVEFVGVVAVDAGEVFGRDLSDGAGDDFADVVGLVFAGDDAFFDEVGDAAGEEFGVDAEVVFFFEEDGECGGDVADSELEGGAIVDDFVSDEGADDVGGEFGFFGAGWDGGDGWREGVFADAGEAVDVDAVSAAGADEVSWISPTRVLAMLETVGPKKTPGPKEHQPSSSGGEMGMRATSRRSRPGGIWPSRKRETGTYSMRPSRAPARSKGLQ